MSFLNVDTYRDFKTVNRYSTFTSQYTYEFPFGSEEMQSLDSRMITIQHYFIRTSRIKTKIVDFL